MKYGHLFLAFLFQCALHAEVALGQMAFQGNRTAIAQTIHVSGTGNDANSGSASSPLRNIQTAVNLASVGDTVKVSAGTFAENIVLGNIFLRGGYDATFLEKNRNLHVNKSIIKPVSGTAVKDKGGSVVDGLIIDGRSGASKGIHVEAGHTIITHNVVYGFLLSFGPGIHISQGTSALVKNNTLVENKLTGGGVIFYAVYIEGNLNGQTKVENNIMANNDVGLYIGPSGVTANYNCVFGSRYFNYDGANGIAGPNDISQDPRLINPAALDFRMKGTSPCVDAGNPSDPAGQEPLPNGNRINIGSHGGTSNATPTGYNPVAHVSSTGSNTNDGSAANPYKTIQFGISNAMGDTVKVTAGTYGEGLITSSKVILLGGYGSSFSKAGRNAFTNRTIIEGVSAIMLNDSYASTVDGFFFDGKGIPTDAAIKVTGASVITHNIIKSVSQSFAAGIETNGGAQVMNNTIVQCSYGIEIKGGTGAPSIKNNIVFNCSFGIVTNAFNASVRTYNCLHSNTFNYTGSDSNPGSGDLALNPLFKDVSTQDYRILATSPCVDAGDPADPAGEEPPPNGGRIDIGAYGGTINSPYRENNEEPASQPTNLSFSNITSSSLTVSFQIASGTPDGYLVLRREGSVSSAVPSDGTSYAVGAALGDATVVYSGSNVSFTQTGLSVATQYFYKVFSYNGSGIGIDYLTTNPLTGNATTLAAEPAAQPTAMTFSEITVSSMKISFTAATGSPQGYIALRKAGSAPTGIPADGSVYTEGSFLGDATVMLFGNSTSFNNSGLLSGTEYFFRIFSFNGSGTLTNYRTVLPLSGSKSTPEPVNDTAAPVVQSNATATAHSPNTNLIISANFTDDLSGISSAKILYRPIAGEPPNDFITDDMVLTSGTTYTYTIPASMVKDLGIEYKFSLQDIAGNSNTSSQTLYKTRIQHDNGMTVPYNAQGRKAVNYRIIAIPLELNARTINSILGDELGEYDPSLWRMFRYNGGPGFEELNGTFQVAPGKGYWFIAGVSASLNSGAGTTLNITSENPFTLSLSPGWNQIGNPYPFDILWSDVIEANPAVSQFLGSNSKVRIFRGAVEDSDELNAFEGGFVKNTSSSIINIKIPAAKILSINGRKHEQTKPRNPLSMSDWEVMLDLEAGGTSYELGGIGMNLSAHHGFDPLDDFNLPRFFEYLEIRFPKEHLGMTFTKDVVPTSDNHVWEFSIESNLPASDGILRWDNSYFGNGKALFLLDVTQHRETDMILENEYRFDCKRSSNFKVIFGDVDFVANELISDHLLLRIGSPSGGSEEYTIEYSLQKNKTSQNCSLQIVNGSGTLLNDFAVQPAPGPGLIRWNSEGRAGGLYLVRLTCGNQSVTRKFIKH